MNLPPLPEPTVSHPGYTGMSYSGLQMQEYARLALKQAMELISPERACSGGSATEKQT